jgi:curved DNA-binding protein CbpA
MDAARAAALLDLHGIDCRNAQAIERAWKRKLLINHPDKNASAQATERTQAVNEAKEVLLKPLQAADKKAQNKAYFAEMNRREDEIRQRETAEMMEQERKAAEARRLKKEAAAERKRKREEASKIHQNADNTSAELQALRLDCQQKAQEIQALKQECQSKTTELQLSTQNYHQQALVIQELISTCNELAHTIDGATLCASQIQRDLDASRLAQTLLQNALKNTNRNEAEQSHNNDEELTETDGLLPPIKRRKNCSDIHTKRGGATLKNNIKRFVINCIVASDDETSTISTQDLLLAFEQRGYGTYTITQFGRVLASQLFPYHSYSKKIRNKKWCGYTGIKLKDF